MSEKLVNKALKIATDAHNGQKRDGNHPYIEHPIRVAKKLQGMSKIAGLLHDVIEDSPMTSKDLLNLGIPEVVVEAVVHLTKKNGENYYDFIMRICSSPLTEARQIALMVKLADIEDNMSDLKEGSLKDKYRLSKHILKETVSGAMDGGFWVFQN